MYGVLAAVLGEVFAQELSASVAVQPEVQSVRQAGVVIVDLREQALDCIGSLGLRAEQGCIDERPFLEVSTALTALFSIG